MVLALARAAYAHRERRIHTRCGMSVLTKEDDTRSTCLHDDTKKLEEV